MLPIGDTANRNLYKNQDWIWEKQTPKPVVHAGSLTPKTTELSSEQNPTVASTHLLTIDLAFAFPARPLGSRALGGKGKIFSAPANDYISAVLE
jgi:hypothetical protein